MKIVMVVLALFWVSMFVVIAVKPPNLNEIERNRDLDAQDRFVTPLLSKNVGSVHKNGAILLREHGVTAMEGSLAFHVCFATETGLEKAVKDYSKNDVFITTVKDEPKEAARIVYVSTGTTGPCGRYQTLLVQVDKSIELVEGEKAFAWKGNPTSTSDSPLQK